MNVLVELVQLYYLERGYKFPDVWKAMAFAETEKAEAYELLLQREGGWVRNNPEGKPAWDEAHFAEELGDIIMMVIAAGMAEGVDPVRAMLDKMTRKLVGLGKIESSLTELLSRHISQPPAPDNPQVFQDAGNVIE